MKVLVVLLVSFSAHLAFAKIKEIDSEKIKPISQAYIQHVQKTYQNLLEENKKLHSAIVDFSKSATDENFNQAKQAWFKAKMSYAKTEVFRFYGGPIDDAEKGPEPLINSWPIDEVYLDYVKGKPKSGIIQNKKDYPVLDKKTMQGLNEKNGERNISTGYHAVEFLLWGQDLSIKSAGQRPLSDFQVKNEHSSRRFEALKSLSELLIDQTQYLIEAWKSDSAFVKSWNQQTSKEILRRIMVGTTSLSADENSGERLSVALEKNDQENEQNCFSDTSLEDLENNQIGIINVVVDTGLLEYLKSIDSIRAQRLNRELLQTLQSLKSIPRPLDKILLNAKSKDRRLVKVAIEAFNTQAKSLDLIAGQIGVTLNVQHE